MHETGRSGNGHAIGLRLLYSTGMRVSEMINLRNKDLNLKTHVLRIRVTKNWEERLAPVNQSLEKALLQYIGYRNRLPAKGLMPLKHIFLSIIVAGKSLKKLFLPDSMQSQRKQV